MRCELIAANLVKTNGVEFQYARADRLADGLECLSRGGVDVVLLDLDLPDSRGLETLQKLRFHEPQVPLVVIADVYDESLATEAASEGAQDYLVKGELHSALLVRSIRYSVSRNKNRAKLAQMLQKAQASEANLRNVVAGNVDGMIVVDDKGAIQFLNPAAEMLLGLSIGDLLRTRFGLQVTASESSETEIIRRDGQCVPVEMRIVDVKWEGNPAFLAMFRDLTAQKRAEAELRESEARFKDLFDNSPDAIFVEDQVGNVLDANPTACLLHNMDRHTLIGKNVLDLVPPDRRDQVARDFPRVVNGELDHVEGLSWTEDGRVTPVEIRVTRFRYTGKPALLFHVRDVTERKRAEEELQNHREHLEELVEERTTQLTKANEELRREIAKRREADEALRKSEAKLQSLIRNVRTAVVVHNSDTSIAMANATACELLDVAEEQLLGKTADAPAWRFLREDGSDMPADEYPVNRVLATRQPIMDYVIGVQRPETLGTMWGLVNAVPEFAADGDLSYVIVSFMDITDQKRSHEALRLSEQRFDLAVRGANEGIWDWQLESNESWVSPRFKELLGYEADFDFGNPVEFWQSQIHPDDFDRVYEALRNHVERRLPYDVEYRLKTRNREWRWFSARGQAFWDEAGKATRMAGSLRDITKRKLAEQALRESETRFRAIFDQTFQFIGLMTPDGRLLEANKTALDFGGVEANDVLEKPFWETVWWTHSAELQNQLRRAVERAASGEFVRFEAYHPAPDGSIHYADVSIRPVKDDRGNVCLLIPEGRDITERKLAEEQVKASLREKEVLLKEIHHRVKNNMQVISSLLNLQSRQIEDDHAKTVFQDMRSRVTSMAMVHEQLYQSGDLARVDFAAHVRSLVSYLIRSYGDASRAVLFHEDIQDVDLTLDMAIPCGLIINELASNALKYAFPDGRDGEIRVSLHLADHKFTLVVADNGVGLPARMDLGATETMGLQVVTTLVKQLDGKIEVERHGGTAFKITFPRLD